MKKLQELDVSTKQEAAGSQEQRPTKKGARMRFLTMSVFATLVCSTIVQADQGPGFGGGYYLDHISSVYCSVKPADYMGPPAEDMFVGPDQDAHIVFALQHVESGHHAMDAKGKKYKAKRAEYTEVFVRYPKLLLEETRQVRELDPELYKNAAVYHQIRTMGFTGELDPAKISLDSIRFTAVGEMGTSATLELRTLKIETRSDGTIMGTIDGVLHYSRYVDGKARSFQQEISFTTNCSTSKTRSEIHR